MGNVGRAHTITMGNGGKSLDVAAKEAGKHFGFGFAQLREFLGHMGDRAVVLAHLRAAGCGAGGSSIAIFGQRFGEHAGAVFGGRRFDQGADAVFEFDDTVTGKSQDRGVSPGALQVSQGIGSQIVISLVEMVAASIRDNEDLGWSATSTRTVDALFARFDDAIGEEEIEVTAHRGRGEMELLGKVDGRGRSLFQD